MASVLLCELDVPPDLSLVPVFPKDWYVICLDAWPTPGFEPAAETQKFRVGVKVLHVVPGPEQSPPLIDAELLAGAELIVVGAAEQPGGDILVAMLNVCCPDIPLLTRVTQTRIPPRHLLEKVQMIAERTR